LGENLDQLVGLIPLAKASQKRITENFRIATFYNVIAVPVAIAGFATPLIAALAMSLSSISVTLNVFFSGTWDQNPKLNPVKSSSI